MSILSEPLSAVLNEQKLSRPQVVKQLWVYIKANELQNPSNKREIVCDDALRRVFNTDKIDMCKRHTLFLLFTSKPSPSQNEQGAGQPSVRRRKLLSSRSETAAVAPFLGGPRATPLPTRSVD